MRQEHWTFRGMTTRVCLTAHRDGTVTAPGYSRNEHDPLWLTVSEITENCRYRHVEPVFHGTPKVVRR
jgi:hypothetical protein